MIVILLTIVRKITIIIAKEEQNVQSIKKKERYFYGLCKRTPLYNFFIKKYRTGLSDV